MSRTAAGAVFFVLAFFLLLSPCTIWGASMVVSGEWLIGLGLLLFNVVVAAVASGAAVEKMMGPEIIEDD